MVPDFDKFEFEHQGTKRDVYKAGKGPAVIVMHEIPGITPEVRRFSKWVAEAGFTVYMPHLFGTPMKPASNGYILSQMISCCISKEFKVLAAHESSPITDWLRALSRLAFREQGGRGVGAIGMCITGNFALSLMLDEHLMAPVLSQPSMPLPFGAERKAALHVSATELKACHERIAQGARILGMRFIGDPVCGPERFNHLKEEFGDAFEAIELEPSCGNPNGKKPPHSVVTNDLIDEAGQPTKLAAQRVLQFFAEQLL